MAAAVQGRRNLNRFDSSATVVQPVGCNGMVWYVTADFIALVMLGVPSGRGYRSSIDIGRSSCIHESLDRDCREVLTSGAGASGRCPEQEPGKVVCLWGRLRFPIEVSRVYGAVHLTSSPSTVLYCTPYMYD
jgi:hypothetical protein